MPALKSDALDRAVEKNHVRIISENEAKALNEKFAREDWSKKYLAEFLDARWTVVRQQMEAAS
jgi:hypothetical protein